MLQVRPTDELDRIMAGQNHKEKQSPMILSSVFSIPLTNIPLTWCWPGNALKTVA
jgi:hypothetical protein